MRKFRISFLVALFAFSQGAFAQQLPLSSQYHQNMLTINPAYSGFEAPTTITASHRSMLTGVHGSPQTNYVSVAGQGDEGKMGLAFVAFQDKTDILSFTSGMVNYVYKAKLGEQSSLNFGLGVGVQNFAVDFSKAQVNDVLDPVLLGSQRQNRVAFNSEFGVVLQAKKLEIGLAIPQLLANNPTITNVDGTSWNYNSVRHIRGSLKYTLNLNEKETVAFYPLVVVRSVAGAPFQWDVNGVLDIKNKAWIGLTYHSTYAISFSAGLRYKGFSFGYAHDIPTGVVNDFSKRSSEFLLSYQLGHKEDKNKELEERLEKMNEDIDNLEEWNEEQDESLKSLEAEKEELKNEVKELEGALEEEVEARKKQKNTSNNYSGNNGSNNTGQNGNTGQGGNSGSSDYRTANVNNFSDESGAKADEGFYVVIGSFGVKANAQRWKRKSIAKGNKKTMILYDASLRMHQVCVFYSSGQDPAMTEKMRRSANQKAWVLKLQ